MSRSYASVFIAGTMLLMGTVCLAQENGECPAACQAAKKASTCAKTACQSIEVAGIDMPFGEIAIKCDTNSTDETTATGQIEIRCECSSDVQFLNNLPYVNRLFKNVGLEDCTPQGGCCARGDAVANGACCDEQKSCCSNGNCHEAQQVVWVAEAACCPNDKCCTSAGEGCSAPVGKCCESKCTECPAMACNVKTDVSECAADCSNCCPSRFAKLHNVAVDMPQFHAFVPQAHVTANAAMDELVELKVTNERLKAQLQAMHYQLELVREMSELRAQNAVLQARVEQYERRAAQTGAGNWIR